jgi:hypothetical protein
MNILKWNTEVFLIGSNQIDVEKMLRKLNTFFFVVHNMYEKITT